MKVRKNIEENKRKKEKNKRTSTPRTEKMRIKGIK